MCLITWPLLVQLGQGAMLLCSAQNWCSSSSLSVWLCLFLSSFTLLEPLSVAWALQDEAVSVCSHFKHAANFRWAGGKS